MEHSKGIRQTETSIRSCTEECSFTVQLSSRGTDQSSACTHIESLKPAPPGKHGNSKQCFIHKTDSMAL